MKIEKEIVDLLVRHFSEFGYTIRMEVANGYRSADIALIDNEEKAWVIECKISALKKALDQLETHKYSADKVFIATIKRNHRSSTIDRIKRAGVGLITVNSNKRIEIEIEAARNKPWKPGNRKLKNLILEG